MNTALTRAEELALGLLGDGSELLAVARRLSSASVGPILGGVAVFLHGYRRTTRDVDIFAEDSKVAAGILESMGATWDPARREHTLDGVPVHIVTPQQTGRAPVNSVEVSGIRVAALPDLVAMKLTSGLAKPSRAQDLADVVGLIRAVPLDKPFAAKLPANLRTDFKRLVDAVQTDDQSPSA